MHERHSNSHFLCEPALAHCSLDNKGCWASFFTGEMPFLSTSR